MQSPDDRDSPSTKKSAGPPAITPSTTLFVTDTGDISFGEAAASLLEQTSDTRYLGDSGIVQVDKSRWRTAQSYEQHTWMSGGGLSAMDDRNTEHSARFEEYRALRSLAFTHMIEIGCGPFTNARLLLQVIPPPQSVTLLDPLVADYMSHPHCPYKNGQIGTVPVTTVALPMEEYEPPHEFDLVVMINVLEHCFDVPRVFDTILRCLQPSGILVFADNAYRATDVAAVAKHQYDCGHPIRVTEDYVDGFLNNHFSPLHARKFYGLYDQVHRIDTYFIGRKEP